MMCAISDNGLMDLMLARANKNVLAICGVIKIIIDIALL